MSGGDAGVRIFSDFEPQFGTSVQQPNINNTTTERQLLLCSGECVNLTEQSNCDITILFTYNVTINYKTILFKCQYPRSLNQCLLLVKFCPVLYYMKSKTFFLYVFQTLLFFYFTFPIRLLSYYMGLRLRLSPSVPHSVLCCYLFLYGNVDFVLPSLL